MLITTWKGSTSAQTVQANGDLIIISIGEIPDAIEISMYATEAEHLAKAILNELQDAQARAELAGR